jgi:uncharacterized protein (DUF1499 family)
MIFLLLMPLAALGSRIGLWPFTLGLLLVVAAVAGCLLIQIVNAIWLLRKPNPETKGVLRGASLIAFPPLIFFALIISNIPSGDAKIQNISTDTQNPPKFIEALTLRGNESNPVKFSMENAILQKSIHPEVIPILSEKSPALAFELALTTAKEMGWEVHTQQADQGRIEATETSLWFGFIDDIAIRITADNQGSRIDLHSVSRMGQSDLGANAKRIVTFSKLFNDNRE